MKEDKNAIKCPNNEFSEICTGDMLTLDYIAPIPVKPKLLHGEVTRQMDNVEKLRQYLTEIERNIVELLSASSRDEKRKIITGIYTGLVLMQRELKRIEIGLNGGEK
ncbi:MAG: hypothetical protein ACPLYF_03930 [Fervidobacterium sp.]